MKKIIFINLIVASFVFTSGVALADCSGAYYGSSSCSDSGFNLTKRVSRNDSTEAKEKLTGIKKGETFKYTFKIDNKTDETKTLKLIDNLPSELERVGGIGFTEEVTINKNDSAKLTMEVKVKDSEFENKKDFEKCVVNTAYLFKDSVKKETSSATVCFGEGTAKDLPATGPSDVLGVVGSLLIGLGSLINRKNR